MRWQTFLPVSHSLHRPPCLYIIGVSADVTVLRTKCITLQSTKGTRSKFSPPPTLNVDNQVIFHFLESTARGACNKTRNNETKPSNTALISVTLLWQPDLAFRCASVTSWHHKFAPGLQRWMSTSTTSTKTSSERWIFFTF